ncbi:MAG: aminotransferase class I/II-fold pyridoxal phosphate-dependent enzyme [Actinomycetota bacterium]|nr:aminotransferase class I/II-fold pyridoxal phosphate-dependent enzyme [Actinomycetota bacterium]
MVGTAHEFHFDDQQMGVILEAVRGSAAEYLGKLEREPVRPPAVEAVVDALDGSLPEEGAGAKSTVERLVKLGVAASIRSVGPRFFHFVIGGVTPAALAADWWASALDQNAYNRVTSPLAARLEDLSLAWLKDLCVLPAAWAGVLTTGGTMANFVGLAAARQWWGERHAVDVADGGMAGLPVLRVFASGHAHPSVGKALAMLGAGRSSLSIVSGDSEDFDLGALRRALRDLRGAPAVIVASTGAANTGAFDPLAAVADLADEHGAWLHVDAAFGIFARATPRSRALTDGIERAHSVAADAHKWLNVPHECGFALVHEARWLATVFSASAAYIGALGDGAHEYGNLGPEMSRRARSMAVWATLHAYGRRGYRELVERCLDLTQYLAARIDAAPDLERVTEPALNIVCFRYRPSGRADEGLDDLNRRLSEAVLADGRVYVGSTVHGGGVALRAVVINWRTTRDDIDLLLGVVRELGARLAQP